MKAIIIDTETTGTKDPDVVELAWAQLKDDWTIESPLQQYFQNEKKMELGALATHHIVPQMLVGAAPSADAPRALPLSEYVIGHNVDFDWKALGSPQVKRICTLALARVAYPEVDSHSLGALMYHVHGANHTTRNKLKNAHSAAADVVLCFELLSSLVEKLDIHSVEQLWAVSEDARIPTRMTFGKYKGELIKDVPKAYKDWYRRQDETDPYVLMAFARK